MDFRNIVCDVDEQGSPELMTWFENLDWSNQKLEFLKQQDIYSRHLPLRKEFPTKRVIVKGIDDRFQANLAEMMPYAKENDGYGYMLTCIDIFSKYSCSQK